MDMSSEIFFCNILVLPHLRPYATIRKLITYNVLYILGTKIAEGRKAGRASIPPTL